MLFSRNQEKRGPLLLKASTTLGLKCGSTLLKSFSGIIDIYNVDYQGYETCNATLGKLLSSIKCGAKQNSKTKTVDITGNEGKIYYLIGKFHFTNSSHKRVGFL